MRGLPNKLQCVIGKGDDCPSVLKMSQINSRGGEKKGGDSVSQMCAAVQSTYKLNQLRSTRKWLALRKNNLEASKKAYSLSCRTGNWGAVRAEKCGCS